MMRPTAWHTNGPRHRQHPAPINGVAPGATRGVELQRPEHQCLGLTLALWLRVRSLVGRKGHEEGEDGKTREPQTNKHKKSLTDTHEAAKARHHAGRTRTKTLNQGK